MSTTLNLPLDASHAASGAARVRLILLVTTTLFGGALFWIAPRPPMGDIAQHVAQIALLRDLVTGTSPWADIVWINWFTPYLLPYVFALALSFVMPVLAAVKFVMMLAYFGFVAGGVALRKTFEADERLDWLLMPGFFGLAWQYGFYPYIVAVPLGLLFMVLARRYAAAPTAVHALGIFAAGVVLFFAHGLVFLFACAVGVAFIPCFTRRAGAIARILLPYVLLGLLIVGYLWFVKRNALVIPNDPGAADPVAVWDWMGPYGWHRAYNFVLYTLATETRDWYSLLGEVFLLAAPWFMGAKLNRRDPSAWVPMLAILVVWFVAPTNALGIDLLYQRFAIFLLPVYVLLFRSASTGERWTLPAARIGVVEMLLVLFCWGYFGTLAVREYRFAAENEPFEALLALAQPEQRALGLIYSPESDIVHNRWTYHTYALWYQAENKGFVDFNFAFFLPDVVRFKHDHIPPVRPGPWMDEPGTFDWHKVDGRIYRYFFVRHTEPLPANFLRNDECEVALVKSVPNWSLYERRACH
ncbi:hypothetical protein LMG27952_00257 [Paraburkholderia hiiakae]|uniref:Glycosyltransferase RgtA/B/C/D-like domain-containing protein n=1 Tax=Paraburkholderia hiiakae TaxID=1081782 RepID=A0ABM8N955_9BURK|nr:hypothetical protein [Paraburkholderia hiiakae]CAD6509228.1 hypothetical protein LMG27952_00257 [Paraburkholderia hiiakae]